MQINFNTGNPMIIKRAYQSALYILEHKCTIRETAKHSGVSLKTTHNDLTKVLPYHYPKLACEVKLLLSSNKHDSVFRAGRKSAQKHKKTSD